MTLGVAVCVRSQLGSSVISTIPYVMASAGTTVSYIPAWTIGTYTVLMNFLLGSWQWQIVGIGTLFAMVYVGIVVRFVNKHLGWFDRILAYQPGFRRYVYGLARYVKR